MSSNRSFLDSLNAGRQRRPHASLEDLNRTLDDLESRFGKLQQPAGATPQPDEDRRARRLTGSGAYDRPRHEPAPARSHPAPEPRGGDAPEALSALRREIERSRQQAAGASVLADISEELRALREEMRHEMTGGMRREFDALRQDIERASAQERTAPDGRDVAAEIERLSRAIHGMTDRSDDDGLRALRAEMEQVRETLAELAREDTVRSMDSRWAEFEERAFARQEPDPAIQALTERLEQIGEAIGNLPDSRALRSLEDKVRTLATAVDHFSRQAAQPDETYETIETRLDEISRAIVATSLAPKPLQPEPFERIEARIAALSAQLDDLAGRSGTEDLLDRLNALSRRVEEIAQDAALPDQAIERLGRQIATIYDRLENDSSAQERELVLDSLERRFAEIAALFEQRHDSATAQGQAMMRDMDRRLEELAARLDSRADDDIGVDAALLQALDEKFADLSERIETSRKAAPDPRLLAEFDRRLNAIANRLDDTFRQAADVDPLLLRALDEKFADLSERIDSRSASHDPDAIRGLEDRLEAIAGRLDAGARNGPDIDPQLIEGLERQLAGLTAQLSRPAPAEPARDELSPRLDRIEQSLADQRDAIVAAAQEAADRAVASMRANGIDDEDVTALAEELATLESLARRSDERNARTFEAIHDTLLKVVERLGSIEARSADLATAHRSRIEPAQVPPMAPRAAEMPMATSPVALATAPAVAGPLPVAPRPQPKRSAAEAAAAAAFAAVESPDAMDEAGAPKKSLLGGLTRAFSGRKQPGPDAPAREEPAAPAIAEVGLDEPLDAAVADQPLEPGSGAPDLNAIMKRVRDERGAAPQRPDAGAAGKADFIAAARRAAQAAAAEAQTFRQASGPEGATRKFSPSEFLRAKRKPILMAATAIMIALAGLQLGKAFFADDARLAAEKTAPAATAALVASAPASAIAADQPQQTADADAAAAGPVRSVDGAEEPSVPADDAMASDEAPLAEEPMDAAMAEPVDGAAEDDAPGEGAMQTAALPLDTGIDEVDAEDAASAIVFEAAPAEAGPLALREAADAGDPKAMFEIGNRYDAGRGMPADRAIAAKWYERAAEQGFAPAQYRIGNFYEKGIGVDRDAAKAKTWYQLAAAQGNASAMHNLAVLFAVGTDGPVDNESAGRWFVKAAELGVKDSQYNLGILAAKGLGVPQNLEESYKWFALVAEAGDKDAAAKRDEVANALRPEQLARARAATELWKPKPLDEDANLVEIPDEWQESPATTASVDMKKAVATIQMILNKNGYDAGGADGIMGEKTRSAIKAFQADNGLSATGEVDDGLVRMLLARK